MRKGWGRVSSRVYDYLGAIYRLGGLPGGCYARIGEIAKLLGVTPPTVSIMVRKLESKGLVEVKSGEGARLTERGLRELTEYLWRFGVFETLLCKVGLEAEEAKRVSAMLSDKVPRDVVDELYRLLGKPRSCPHGKPIPEPGTPIKGEVDFCGLPCNPEDEEAHS